MRMLALVCVVLASGPAACSGSDSGGSGDEADSSMQAWPVVSSTCGSCLEMGCASAAGGQDPYVPCRDDSACRVAFASFVDCYDAQRSLTACASEARAVKASGTAGEALLGCFLRDCFQDICEVYPGR